jgi:subtilisin family serine protease
MSSVTIEYGGQKMSLTKSSRLIAVKPTSGMASSFEGAVRGLTGQTLFQDGGTLGGFKILEVSDPNVDADQQLDILRAHSAIGAGTHVFHTGKDNVPFVPTGEIYIKFKSETSAEKRQALINDCQLEIVETRGKDAVITRITPASQNPVKTTFALQQSELVSVAEPELATQGRLKSVFVADPLLRDQWHLQNRGEHRGTNFGFKKGADARVLDAWETLGTVGDPSVIVAVIDDGFDLNHPDLSGPGKVVHPWDFTRNSDQPTPDPATADWHGTACAGVAVGRIGGGMIVGAAPGSTLMPVRWGRNLSDGEIEDWFEYVEKMGAAVVSCSWGAAAEYFPLSTRASEAISRCATNGRNGKGCVIVFAAGNSNHDINDPANQTLDGFAVHPDVIAVAASTSRDERSNYSNFGKEIWICAPSSGAGGWGIITADVTGVIQVGGTNYPLGYASGDYTFDFGGTSSACPLVAGICALILSASPDLSPQAVKEILKSTARKIGTDHDGATGHSRYFGYGCIDAAAGVSAVLPIG